MENNENIALIKKSIKTLEFSAMDLAFCQNIKVIPVLVTIATELTVSEYESVSVILSEKIGKEVCIEKLIEPSIMGGIIVKIGDKVFDASVKRQLEKVSAQMGKVQVDGQSL